MDHVINAIMAFLNVEIEYLRKETSSGSYKRLSDCPSYKDCKAMVDAIHVLERAAYGEIGTPPVKELLDF